MIGKICIAIIRGYQLLISPYFPGACRFVPSCSQYAIDAIRKYGALKGIYRFMGRLFRCHPFHPGGIDPV